MCHTLERLFALRKIEYAVIDRNWKIVQFSPNLSQFADLPEAVQIDRDIRLSFPELVGAEAALERILRQQSHLALRKIARSNQPESPLYIDLCIVLEEENDSCDRFVVFVEDVTDRALLEQQYIQSSHENSLLTQQLRQTEAELRATQDRFDAFMDNSPIVAFMKDAQGRNVYVNAPFERIFNVEKSWLKGKTDVEWLPVEIAQRMAENDHLVLSAGKPIELIETVHLDAEQPRHWLICKFPFTNAEQQFIGGVAIDITERKLMEEALFQEKELAQVTLQSIGDAVITTNAAGIVQYLNPVAEQLTGWSQEESQGLPLINIFQIVNELTGEPVENPVEIALRDRRIAKLAQDTILIPRSGKELAIDDSAAPIHARDGRVVGAVMVFHDVTHTRTLTRELCWQANHDALTGLFNRREFEERLEQAVESVNVGNQYHALCFLDLDRFKAVNDTCGHAAGDELLQQISTLLQAHIRQTDTLARLGGDEFGILLHQCPLARALHIADRIRVEIEKFRFVWENQVFSIGVSIGVVNLNTEKGDMESVLSAADAACYAAKHRGRNRVHVYQSDDSDLLRQRGEMQWVTRLVQALEADQFCLYYQPIVPAAAPQMPYEHYEVLLRLHDEQGNLIFPGAFLPAAERYGLMHLIDRWVIRTLFAAQGQHYRNLWRSCQQEEYAHRYLFAVNLSGASINDDQFVEFIQEQFLLHQISPQLICFEITETVAIANLTKAAQLVSNLRDFGCRFALDDFGNGMSSFAYLKHLPVDFLKIDGEFVKHIAENPIDAVMVEAMHQIGQVMGIETIAEFVENDQILERLRSIGVNYVQGYGIAQPRPCLSS